MNYKPLISIISPTYNHEKYIEECIESVLCQSYENWEMIIVDDASTDKTPEMVQKYVNKDSRIKLIRHNENYGPFYLDKTYNEALSIAKGDWIAILEGDDVWLPYKLEKQVEILNKYPSENIVLVSSFIGHIREDLNIVIVPNPKISLFTKNIPKNSPYNPLEFLLLGFNPVYSQTVLIRRKALEKIGGFIQKPREIRLVDYTTWLRLALQGNFYLSDEITAFWRRHSFSITMNYSDVISVNLDKAVEIFLEENRKISLMINNKKCLGAINFFSGAFASILKEDWNQARFFIQRFSECLKEGYFDRDWITLLKLFILKLSLWLKNKSILKLSFKLKATKMDKLLCDYKPFFFKDAECLSSLQKLKA